MQKNNDSRLSARQPSSNKSFSAKSLLPMLTQVNDRIIAFEVKIEQWDKLAAEAATVSMDPLDREKIVSCQDEVNAILSRYEDVHQLLIRESQHFVLEPRSTDGSNVGVIELAKIHVAHRCTTSCAAR